MISVRLYGDDNGHLSKIKKRSGNMKKLGKIVALLLAATLVLSLVACGGDKDTGDKTLKIFGDVGSSDGYSVLDEKIVNQFKEKTMSGVFLLSAFASIFFVLLICVFLFANGIPAMQKIGFFQFLFVPAVCHA